MGSTIYLKVEEKRVKSLNSLIFVVQVHVCKFVFTQRSRQRNEGSSLLFSSLLLCGVKKGYLLTGASAGLEAAPGCKLLSWCWMIGWLLDAPPLGITGDDVIVATMAVGLVVPGAEWPVWPSTGFLERWRPLFMCLSQYFWSATASLEHRHFFPSVRRHLPGSGSVLPEKPKWKEPHPTVHWQRKTPEKRRMREIKKDKRQLR